MKSDATEDFCHIMFCDSQPCWQLGAGQLRALPDIRWESSQSPTATDTTSALLWRPWQWANPLRVVFSREKALG
eukprot:2594761-Rhodomonas_salina.2